MAINNCTTNCTWGRVKAPFESQINNTFYLNGAWRVNQDAFYQIPLANWTHLWNNICKRWNENNPVLPMLGALFKLPISPCPKDLMNIHNLSGKW